MSAILVIDDEPQARKFIATVLEGEGFNVSTASNGKEALDLIRHERFDLVVTDLYMPETDGMETIMELRKIHPDVKIIAVSGGGMPGDVLSFATSLGAEKALAKPFTVNQVISAVNELLDDGT
ncbi:MAG: response regulator [Pseudomonadales bacterium]|nr:response regulator [Pseudomonadales bacterium]